MKNDTTTAPPQPHVDNNLIYQYLLKAYNSSLFSFLFSLLIQLYRYPTSRDCQSNYRPISIFLLEYLVVSSFTHSSYFFLPKFSNSFWSDPIPSEFQSWSKTAHPSLDLPTTWSSRKKKKKKKRRKQNPKKPQRDEIAKNRIVECQTKRTKHGHEEYYQYISNAGYFFFSFTFSISSSFLSPSFIFFSFSLLFR